MPNGIVERIRGGRLGCRGRRLSCQSAALRELGDQTPMLGFCSALRLHLSVSAVALSLTACCLVRDINDPVGLAVPIFFANGHVGDVLQPWLSPAWPVKGITGSRSVVLYVTLSTVFRKKRASDSRTFVRARRPRSLRSHRRRCEPLAARKAFEVLPLIRRASARRRAARTNGVPTRVRS